MVSPQERPDVSHEDLVLAHLPLIDRIVASLARRRRLDPADAEDLAASVRLKLLQDDCAAVRRFDARGTFESYLASLIHRQYVDFLISHRGKWHPSREAERLGWIAERLEVLLVREGRSFGEACEILQTNDGVRLSEAELEAIRVRLPCRAVRRFVPEEALDSVGRGSDDIEQAAASQAVARSMTLVREALAAATRELSPEDQWIVRLKFDDGRSMAVIGRTLNLDSKPLYRRLKRILKELRRKLELRGVTSTDIDAILASLEEESSGGSTLVPHLRIRQEGPSV